MTQRKPRREKVDTDALLRSVDIVQVIERLGVPLKKAGAEFEACCPFHTESTPSFKVSTKKQMFHCFGCGANGDAIGFAKDYLRVSFREACEIVAGGNVPTDSTYSPAPKAADRPAQEHTWTPILPVPAHAPPPPAAHYVRGLPLAVYPYRAADGALMGYTYRLKRSDGGKTVEPLVWARNMEGAEEWRWLSFPVPRPLYGLDRLAAKPGAAVLLVEGEKCADVGHVELPGLAVLSWPGGGKAPQKSDFSPLAGARVILFPDADAKREKLTREEKEAGIAQDSKLLLPADEQPGMATMIKIRDMLWALDPPCDVWMVEIPEPEPTRDGWDVADLVAEGTTGEALAGWIRGRSRRLSRPAPEPSAVGIECGDAPPSMPFDRPDIGDAPPFDPDEKVVNVDFAHMSALRRAFFDKIHGTDDFDVLILKIAPDVESSELKGAVKHTLLKLIAKKAGTTVAALKDDLSGPMGGGGGGDAGGTRVSHSINELNEIHAVVRLGGRTRIMTERTDPETGCLNVTFCGRNDFVLLYENRRDYLDGELIELGEAWLKHPARRQYDDVVFAPGAEAVPEVYNLWQGFSIEPDKGEKHLGFMSLVRDSICADNALAFRYVVCWMAHMIQKPGDLPGSALVLRSGQRTGKGSFAEVLGRLVGSSHYVELSNPAHLVGQFTGHLERAILVHASEAFWAGHMKQHEGTIKALITDKNSIMERKGVDALPMRNYKRLIVSTNNDQPLPRDTDDARLVVLDVSDAHKEDHGFFKQMWADMEGGGYASLMHFLKYEVDLGEWHPRAIPRELRKAGHDMKIASADTFTRWWYECLWQGWITREAGIGGNDPAYCWPEEMTCERFREAYMQWCRGMNMQAHSILGVTQIGRRVKKWGLVHAKIGNDPLRQRNGYRIPSPETARAWFAEATTMDVTHFPEL